jgi:hypothetical protein
MTFVAAYNLLQILDVFGVCASRGNPDLNTLTQTFGSVFYAVDFLSLAWKS